jgi:hypothetical protein
LSASSRAYLRRITYDKTINIIKITIIIIIIVIVKITIAIIIIIIIIIIITIIITITHAPLLKSLVRFFLRLWLCGVWWRASGHRAAAVGYIVAAIGTSITLRIFITLLLGLPSTIIWYKPAHLLLQLQQQHLCRFSTRCIARPLCSTRQSRQVT